MSTWEERKLSQIAYLAKDVYIPKEGAHLPYIGLEHIQPDGLRLLDVGDSDSVTSHKFYFEAGDVLFGKLRPYFRKVVSPKFKGVCSTDIWVMRAQDGVDQNFLFYFAANQEFVDLANSGDSGTRMPRADWHFMKDTTWKLPPLPEQRAIAAALSSLDDKIDLLHRQNKTLESLASALWRKMFIEEVDKCWAETKIGNVITVKGGTTPSSANSDFWDGDIPWTSPRDLSSHDSVFLFDTTRKITKAGLAQIGSGLLPVGSVLLSSRAPIGYLVISDIEVAINQGYIGIICDKGISNYYMYMWIKHNMDTIIGAANGSTFLEISKSVFKELEFIRPDGKILEQYNDQVSPIFQKVRANQKDIRAVSKLRDALLPKLLSGEITAN